MFFFFFLTPFKEKQNKTAASFLLWLVFPGLLEDACGRDKPEELIPDAAAAEAAAAAAAVRATYFLCPGRRPGQPPLSLQLSHPSGSRPTMYDSFLRLAPALPAPTLQVSLCHARLSR